VKEEYHISRAADLTALGAFRDLIGEACAEHNIDQETCYDLKLAVDEACTIILTHGYVGMNPGSVELSLGFQPRQVVVTVTDFGNPFEPCEPPPPDLTAEAGDDAGECFGMFFIYQAMDEIHYEAAADGNHLTFIKLLGA
jgi:anti-sigma regulatory factor (Ser/Thr protein kinase)